MTGVVLGLRSICHFNNKAARMSLEECGGNVPNGFVGDMFALHVFFCIGPSIDCLFFLV